VPQSRIDDGAGATNLDMLIGNALRGRRSELEEEPSGFDDE
jgi:hypothetical protein